MDPGQQVLEAKIALEHELAGPLFMVGRQYLKAAGDARALSGGALPSLARMGHQHRIEMLLRRHYARCTMVMTGRRPSMQVRLEEAALGLQHLERLAGRAKNQSLQILAGLDRDLAASTIDYVDSPVANDDLTKSFRGDIETKKERGGPVGYALRIGQSAWSKLRTRIGAIANYETQGPSEEARFLLVADQYASGRVMHQWLNMGDLRVRRPPRSRFDHVAPGGQTVPVTQPFEVSGQLLRFPGDMSLGASIGNVINCRCHVRYYLAGKDGGEEEIYLGPSAPKWNRRPLAKPGPGDNRPAYNPTTSVTLNGTTRARVILGNGEVATLRQERADLITVRLNGETVARARVANGEVAEISISPAHREKDIEGLIRRSVEGSARR